MEKLLDKLKPGLAKNVAKKIQKKKSKSPPKKSTKSKKKIGYKAESQYGKFDFSKKKSKKSTYFHGKSSTKPINPFKKKS